MNERIKELVRESHLDVYGLGLDKAKWEHTIKKFADLIVKECAGICHKMAEDSDSYVVHDGDTCAEQIKQHFGVEE
jgi:hypothetical protein